MNFSTGKHIIKFSATWCGPCKTYAPIFDETVAKFEGVEIHRLDVDENPDATTAFGVRGVPTTLFVKDGAIVGTKVGVASSQELETFFEKL